MAEVEVKMATLIAAEEGLKRLQEKLAEYERALVAANQSSHDKRNLRVDTRVELRDAAALFYQGSGDEAKVKELSRIIHELEDGIVAADLAASGLEQKIEFSREDVEGQRRSVRDLRGLARMYEQAKILYPKSYTRAKWDRDDPLSDLKAKEGSVLKLRKLREDFQVWAQQLGCVEDCQQFLAAVEDEGK
jgi:hypothetical protein